MKKFTLIITLFLALVCMFSLPLSVFADEPAGGYGLQIDVEHDDFFYDEELDAPDFPVLELRVYDENQICLAMEYDESENCYYIADTACTDDNSVITVDRESTVIILGFNEGTYYVEWKENPELQKNKELIKCVFDSVESSLDDNIVILQNRNDFKIMFFTIDLAPIEQQVEWLESQDPALQHAKWEADFWKDRALKFGVIAIVCIVIIVFFVLKKERNTKNPQKKQKARVTIAKKSKNTNSKHRKKTVSKETRKLILLLCVCLFLLGLIFLTASSWKDIVDGFLVVLIFFGPAMLISDKLTKTLK